MANYYTYRLHNQFPCQMNGEETPCGNTEYSSNTYTYIVMMTLNAAYGRCGLCTWPWLAPNLVTPACGVGKRFWQNVSVWSALATSTMSTCGWGQIHGIFSIFQYGSSVPLHASLKWSAGIWCRNQNLHVACNAHMWGIHVMHTHWVSMWHMCVIPLQTGDISIAANAIY